MRGYCAHCGQYVRVYSRRDTRPFVHSFNGAICPGRRARVFWDHPDKWGWLRWLKPWPQASVKDKDDA